MNFNKFYEQYHPNYAGNSIIPHPLPCEFALSFFNEKKNGVFIDVGAHDGVGWSNTLILEKLFDWSGLCIEANGSLFEDLKKVRTCVCLQHAIDYKETEQTFWNITGNASGLGGLESGFQGDHAERIKQELILHPESICEKVLIITKRLDTILKSSQISTVDYLSIDVEGNELGVLKSFDFENYDCGLISVESNDRESVQKHLSQFGYNLITKICADDFYAKT